MTDIYDRIRINQQPKIYRCEPGWTWAPDFYDSDFWCVLKGRGTVVVDDETSYDVQAGNVFLFQPGDTVMGTHDPTDPLSVFAVHCDVLGHDGDPITVPMAERPRPGNRIGDLQLLTAMTHECIRGYREGTVSGRERSERFLQLLMIHSRDMGKIDATAPPDPRIARTLDAIHEHPGHRWTVTELAKLAYLSRAQFSKCFTAELGVSPMKYAVSMRIERARELLTETSMSISQIAEALAYTDVFHFSKQFKRETGNTPSAYRDAG